MDLNCYSILRCLLWNYLHLLLPISMSTTTAIHTFQLVTPWSCSRKRYFGFFCDNFVSTMYSNWEKIQCTVLQLHKWYVYPKLDSWFNFWYVQCTAYIPRDIVHNYLLITEFEVWTVSYGTSFSAQLYGVSTKRKIYILANFGIRWAP